jgi:hypothetical protein
VGLDVEQGVLVGGYAVGDDDRGARAGGWRHGVQRRAGGGQAVLPDLRELRHGCCGNGRQIGDRTDANRAFFRCVGGKQRQGEKRQGNCEKDPFHG